MWSSPAISAFVRPWATVTTVPALWSGRLSPEGIQQVLRGARGAGLLDPGADFGSSHLVDGGSTTFRFTLDDTQGSVTVGALVESEASDIAHLPTDQRRR